MENSDQVRHSSKSKFFGMLTLLTLVIAIPTTVFLSQQRQELRQRASESTTSSTTLKGAVERITNNTLIGWTCDTSDTSKSAIVSVYLNREIDPASPFTGRVSVFEAKEQNAGATTACGGSAHGFSIPLSNNTGTLYVYGVSVDDNRDTAALTGSPKSLTSTDTPAAAAATTVATNVAPVAPPLPAHATGITFTVILHGIGAGGDTVNADATQSTKNPKRKTRSAVLSITDKNDSPASRQEKRTTLIWNPGTQKFDGSVDLSAFNLTANDYIIKISVDNFLTKRVPALVHISPTNTTTFAEVELSNGDVNSDNELTNDDLKVIRECLVIGTISAKACDIREKTLSDINDDGSVDSVDEILFRRESTNPKGD